MYYKAKGQPTPIDKPELLALANFGVLAERSNAVVSKTTNGATNTVQGSESLTLRHLDSPVMALTITRELNCTAEAARSRKISIGFLAVKLNRRFHSDLSQLQNRLPEVRKAQRASEISVR
jgi:hypothetical protein